MLWVVFLPCILTFDNPREHKVGGWKRHRRGLRAVIDSARFDLNFCFLNLGMAIKWMVLHTIQTRLTIWWYILVNCKLSYSFLSLYSLHVPFPTHQFGARQLFYGSGGPVNWKSHVLWQARTYANVNLSTIISVAFGFENPRKFRLFFGQMVLFSAGSPGSLLRLFVISVHSTGPSF